MHQIKIKINLFMMSCMLIFALSCSTQDNIGNENNGPSALDLQLMQEISSAAPSGDLEYFMMPMSDDYGNIPQDPNNPLNKAKVEVGQLLFHETGLGNNPTLSDGLRTYGCASCHHAGAGFQAGVPQGIGEGGSGFGARGEARVQSDDYAANELDIQPIRTPTAMNGAYQDIMLWNGQFGGRGTNAGTEMNWTSGTPIAVNELGFEGLESQAIAGFNVHRLKVDDDFFQEFPQYRTMMDQAFPGMPQEEKLSNIGVGLAMAAYERTLLSNEAPFQKWLKGETEELTDASKRGALVFFGKGNCVNCHTGPALSSNTFHALGMNDLDALLTDASNAGFVGATKGRGGFTKDANDEFKFKTPSLYNLKDHNFFGHGATLQNVREVVEYKNNAVVENAALAGHPNIAADFVPLNLSRQEIDDLVVFLEDGLYDADLGRYVPKKVLSGGCIPVNDAQGKVDLGGC